MAARYWVGGTGTWNSTNTTNWSTTSGGAGGASVPTGADNVFFNALSGGGVVTATNENCQNLDFTGFTGTFALGTTNPQVYGNLVLSSAVTYSTTIGGLSLMTAGSTIQSNGATFNAPLNLFNSITLLDALNLGSTSNGILKFFHTSSVLTTNNFNITCNTIGSLAGGTFNCGSSTITINGTAFLSSYLSPLTLNAGTSTFNFTSASAISFSGRGLTYYNLNFTGGGTTTISIAGANTFNNLSFTATTSGTKNVTFDSTNTINGTLTTSGTTTANRIQFGSSVAGTQRTLSVANSPTATNANFKDIALTGAGSPWSAPLSVLDLGNNSGITFNNGPIYWVGGAGTWNATSATNWALTSGGTGGAAIPGPNTNVVFDTNSGTGNVTISNAVCNDITVTASQAIILAGGTSTLTVYGSLSFPSGGSFACQNFAWNLVFAATTTGKTITTNGKGLPIVSWQGVGGEWTLQSNISAVGNFSWYFQAGTLNTNNYSMTTSASYSRTVTTAFTLNLGSSTINTGGGIGISWDMTNSTNLTINPGTSTIVMSNTNAGFKGGGLTYYNVSHAATSGTVTFTGTNTYNNLSIGGPSSDGTITALFANNQTINGVLTTTSTTGSRRVQFGSSVAGTQRTLTVANAPTATNANFKDIALTGAASPWTAPLGVWDLGNNSGITFDTSTLYWIGGAGASSGTKWSTSTGGSAANALPGPQNNVVIDTNSGTGSLSGTVLCNDFTSTATQAISPWFTINTYGNMSLSSAASPSFIGAFVNFLATSTGKTIDANNKSLSTITFNGVGGGWTLTSAFTSLGTVTFTNGTFDTGNFNFSPGGAVSISSGTTVSFGSSTVSINSVFNVNSGATLNLGSSSVSVNGTFTADAASTINAGTSTISITATTATNFAGGGKTYYNVAFTGVGSAVTRAITGANTFNNLTLTYPSSAGQNVFTIGANQIVNGTLSSVGNSGNVRIAITSDTIGTQRTITAAAVSLTDTTFYGIIGAGAATWSGTRVGNATLNSGITFDSPKTVYWNLAAGGNWMTSTAWATSSGGTAATTNFPLPQDTAIVEDTGLNTSATINVGTAGVYLSNIDFSGRTLAMTFGWNATPNACGNITWDANVTSSGTSAVTFFGSTTLTSAGVTLTPPITVAVGASVTTVGTLTSSSTLTSNGTLTLGANATFTTCTLNANSTTNFSTNKILLTGSGALIFKQATPQTLTGTPRVDLTYSGSVGTRSIQSFPAGIINVDIYITAGSDAIDIFGSTGDLNFTGFSGTLASNTFAIYGNLTISSGMTVPGGTSTITFSAVSPSTKTITTNGRTIDRPINFNGGTWQLADNLTQGSTRATTLTTGTLDLNGKTYTVGSFATAAGTKNLTFNGGTLVCPAVTATAFNNAQPANFTTTAGTGTGKISMTGATAKTFVGGGSTYNCTLEQAGAGALTITGSNTFNDITNTTQPVSVLFTAGTTNTFNNFSLSGTSGNLVTIGSVTAASHTLSKSSGIVNVSYCTISRSTATGGATWQAYTTNGNVNGGNNSGWIFSAFSGNGLFFGSNF